MAARRVESSAGYSLWFVTDEPTQHRQVIKADDVFPDEPLGFTNCVRFGDVPYLSGMSGVDVGGNVAAPDIEGQTRKTFDNIERVLRAGGSELSQLIQMTSFVVNLAENGKRYVAARRERLSEPTYTSATIGVAALLIPGLLLEVQVCAAVA